MIAEAIEVVEEETLEFPSQGPGFVLAVADEDLQKLVRELDGYLDAQDWANAFRLLSVLPSDQMDVVVAVGDGKQHVAMKEQLRRRLLSLPPDGLRAYRLYFDGQALEQMRAVRDHPMPGSADQLARLQALADRFIATSVGGEAAAMLGDLSFQRGLFIRAERAWGRALEQGLVAGEEALALQVKRAIAMHRAGRAERADDLYRQLRARYGRATLRIGGEPVDAIGLLDETLGRPADEVVVEDDREAGEVELLPRRDALPQWHLMFLDEMTRSVVNESRNRQRWYRPPQDLEHHIPPVAADDRRVYFHWLGAVFALDRQTGKILWNTGSVPAAAQRFQALMQTNQGDPRGYHLAVTDDTVLVTTGRVEDTRGPMALIAYDKASGREVWNSQRLESWRLPGFAENNAEKITSVIGRVLIADRHAYVVTHPAGSADCYLTRFDPTTGEVGWTLPLGDATRINFQNTQVSRMPQPQLAIGESMVYAMMNNGATIAVDIVSREIKWALRTEAPFGLDFDAAGQRFLGAGNQLGNQIEAMANLNGSGSLILRDGVLYIKEHNSKALYAVDAERGTLQWSADKLKPDARLVGIDDERFYVVDHAIASYRVADDHNLVSKNKQTGSPRESGALFLEDRILTYADGRLRQFETTHLDPAGRYSNDAFLGLNGGRLYRFDDLLVCIDTRQITAFRIEDLLTQSDTQD